MDFKTSYKVAVYCYIIAFIVALLGYGFSGGAILAFIAAGILIFGIIQTLFFLKCPECNSYINARGGKPNHCANCGKKLDWD